MTRFELLSLLISQNNYKKVAEIGVYDGEASFYLLKNTKITQYIGVDKNFKPEVKKSLMANKMCQCLEVGSTEAASKIPNGSLDLVFIDGDHAYEAVKADILAWLPKVRVGGIISGHDYASGVHQGVRKAVDELFSINDIIQYEDCLVWAVKIKG